MRRERAHAPSGAPRAGRRRAWARSILFLALAACRGSEPQESPLDAQPVVITAGGAPAVRRTLPALLALQAAVEDGEDALARELIAVVRRHAPDEATLELVDAYERILRGRELVQGLELRLGAQPDAEEGQEWIVLHATNTNAADVVLRLPPAAVERRRTVIDAEGGGGHRLKTRRTDALADLALASGELRTVPIVLTPAARGDALAVREGWRLELLAGEIATDDAVYPAARVSVEPFERTLISPSLPQAVVSADEALACAAAPECDAAETLRLAVRVPRAEHPGLRARLAPLLEQLEREDPLRAAALAPVLTWIAGPESVQAGAWDAPFVGERADAQAPPRPRLDLPFPPRKQ